HIEAITLQREGDHRERHSSDGSSKQEHQPELDQPSATLVHAVAQYAADAAQVRRLATKDAVVRRFAARAAQTDGGSPDPPRPGHQEANPQQAADRPFAPLVRPPRPFVRHRYPRPVTPL